MSDVSTWDTDANNNNAPPPDGFPEGQTPGSLNDCSREVMAAVARWRDGFYCGDAAISGTLSVTGNTTLSSRLRVNANASIQGEPLNATNISDLTIHGGSSGSLISLKDNADNRKTELSWDPSITAGFVGTFASDNFQIRTNNTARVTVDASGNVGIATSSPNARLEVEDGGTSKSMVCKITQDNQSVYGIVIGNDTFSATDTDGLRMSVGDGGLSTIESTGTGAEFQIVINGTTALRIDNNRSLAALAVYSDIVGGTNRDLYIDNTGKFGYVSSADKYKKNKRPLKDTDFLMQLQPMVYDRITGEKNEIGLIADKVAKVAPRFVYFDNEGNPEGIDYKGLIVPMLARLQQLEARLSHAT